MTRPLIARARAGSIHGKVEVRMDAKLLSLVTDCARTEGVSLSEFLRRSAHERILRQAAAPMIRRARGE